jgi:LacI family transcriptional regulator
MNKPKLAVIALKPDDVFQRTVITGVQRAASDHNCEVVIKGLDQQLLAIASTDLQHYAGVLIVANAISDGAIQSIYKSGQPISLVCHQIPDMPIPSVMSNNIQGTAELVRHLAVNCQRRDLVFIRGIMTQNDGKQREAAFRQEIVRYGLKVPDTHFLNGEFSAQQAAVAVKQLIASGQHFDGILAADYVMAIAAVQTLCAAGIRVPGMVSVVGFGDSPESEAAGLTTVSASIAELGACATRQLISQIEGMRISGVTMLNVQLVIRQTCGYQQIDPTVNP